MKKRILSAILCMAMVFPLFGGMQGGTVAEAAGIDANDYCADISEYRTGAKETWTYPTKEGYVFAGWYTKKDFQQKYALTDTMVTGGAYAKFVDEDVFSVKYQMNELANIADATMNLRMLTTVDDLTYQSVGFRFESGSTSTDFTSDTVYTSILANGETIAPSVFSDEANFIVGHSLDGIPREHYGAEFTITPFVVTLDGTTVEGVERSLKIREDYKVAGDATVVYSGSGDKDFWFKHVKINAGQWITFDLEGLPRDGAGSVYFMVYEGDAQKEGFNNVAGNKFWYKAKGDKIRYYGKVSGNYADHTVGIRLFKGHGVQAGEEITISNLRITDEPVNALYYNVDHSNGAYFAAGEYISMSAKAGQVLSYKVDVKYGNLLNQERASDPKAWILLNDQSSNVVNATRTKQNADGTQTVEIQLTKDMTSFQPTFTIQNLPDGVTENKLTITDIKILDAMNNEGTASTASNASTLDWKYTLAVKAGQVITFDIDCYRALNVYVVYNGSNKVGNGIVCYMKSQRGTYTVTYVAPTDLTDFTIQFRDFNDKSPYPVKVSNLRIK